MLEHGPASWMQPKFERRLYWVHTYDELWDEENKYQFQPGLLFAMQ